jgi:PAS domain S-box-containing protein
MRARREHPDAFHGTPRGQAQPQPSHAWKTPPEFRSDEDLHRILYEDSPTMYFTLDCQGIVLSVNRFGADQLGYTVGELTGRSVLAVFHDEDRHAVHRQLALLLEQPGQARRWQLRKVRKDGTVMWVEEVARAVRRENGSLVILVVCSDISDHKRVEEKLRESRQQYKLLVDHATDIIYRTDPMGTFTFVNPNSAHLMGHSESELIGHRFTEFIRPDHQERAARFYWRQLLRKTPATYFEFPAVAKDGREIWFGQNVQILLEDGRVTGFSAVARDITERKRAEKALQESEERFRQLADHVKEVFWMSDVGKISVTYVSPAYQEIWGRTLESLYASPRSWLDAIHPDDRDRVLHAATTKQSTGEYDEEYRILRPDGSIRWIRDQAFPIRDETGHVYRVAGIARDVTERKRTEEALHAARQEREQLARNLHDNIIQAIYAIGLTVEESQSLAHTSPAGATRKLDQVVASLNRVIREVRGYLAVPVEKEAETISGDDLVASFEHLGKLMEHADGVRFTMAISSDAACALTGSQRAQFLYVAQEAMSNSLRHSSASTARVSLARTSRGVRLEIRDNGVGFALSRMRNGNGGLKNIRLRARKIGANLDIASHPMGGTIVSMEVQTGT